MLWQSFSQEKSAGNVNPDEITEAVFTLKEKI
jgi:hypothetical protein